MGSTASMRDCHRMAEIDLQAALNESIDDLDALVARFEEPRDTSLRKESVEMTALEQEFVRQSPFFLLATASADGACDVTPRGDPPGAVRVLDARTLVFADRPGNRRLDSLRNIVENSRVGLLFVIPGADETLRINGRATISTYQPLLHALALRGRSANVAVIVRTEAVYMHCARALIRSSLWDTASWPEPERVPQMPAILKDKRCLEGTVEDIAAERRGRYATEPI